MPRPTTGAFAAVFALTAPEGQTVAAKCFLSDAGDQQARYRAVADHLATANLPCTVRFDYQPEGIRVAGDAFPLLKMEWAEGAPLNRYVQERLGDPDALSALAETWAGLLASLEEAGFAHGDLQHGNVLVRSDAPSEKPRTRREQQSAPAVRLVDYDTAYVPALKQKKSAEVGHRNYQHPDRTEEDFGPHLDRFAGLTVYVAVRALAARPALWKRYDTGENLLFRAADFYDPDASPLFAELREIEAVADDARALRAACHHALEDVPSLADVRRGAAPSEVSSVRTARRPRRPEASRDGLARWFAPASASVLAAAAALAAFGFVAAAFATLLAGAAVGAALATRRYRQHPVVRRRRRLRQEQARFAEQIETLRREEDTLRAQRRDVRSRREERRAERLAEVREEALRDRLKHHFIGEVRAVPGLSHRTVVRLKAAGIRTAHEATPEAVEGVTKLGPKSTARLRQWRAALTERYADDLPEALSPAQERRLERYAERRVEQIDREIARTHRKVEAQEAERIDAATHAEALPELSSLRYLRYLLRLDASLPTPEDAAPAAPPPAEPRSSTSAERPSEPAPAPASKEQPWYQTNEGPAATEDATENA